MGEPDLYTPLAGAAEVTCADNASRGHQCWKSNNEVASHRDGLSCAHCSEHSENFVLSVARKKSDLNAAMVL